jgi:hypothetical protein
MMNEKKDPAQQLYEIGLGAGRSKQSPQTNYVHYCYHSQDEDQNDTIPLYDNLLFMTSLLRSRTTENVLEAKELLPRLLKFQNREEGSDKGNFPVYLHEYPACRDKLQAAHVLPVFYWLIKQFQPILGADLSKQLTEASELALNYALKTHAEKPAPFHLAIKIAGAAKAFGDLWGKKHFAETGEHLLAGLKKESEEPDFGTWYCPPYVADMLVGLQMVYPSLPESPWNHFWKLLSETWHRPSCSYIGPGIKDFQDNEEANVTLYDYFLGYFSGQLSYRSFSDHPRQLQGLLVQPIKDPFPELPYPFEKSGSIAGLKWTLKQYPAYAVNVVEKRGAVSPQFEKGYYPLRVVWGDFNKSHSFVCQGGTSTLIEHQFTDKGVDLYFTFEEPPLPDDKDKNREIQFFCDYDEANKILVGGLPATTFQIDDQITIKSNGFTIGVKISFVEGDARYFGHIMLGNRPAQVSLKGNHRFSAFDWQLFLRTVRRTVPCKMKAEITFTPS